VQRLLFFVAFGVAVLSLPEAWSAWRQVARSGEGVLWALVWTVVLSGALFASGLLLYAADRRAGRVRRRIALDGRISSGAQR